MFIAKVIKKITATEKHPAYRSKTVFVVQPIRPNGAETGKEWVAVDYLGANIGSIVVCGGAPGVAKSVFGLELAPIRTLILAIVEEINYTEL